jgi:hypothetical protein
VTDKFGGWTSLAPMWHQIQEMGEDLMKVSVEHPEGINLIGTYFYYCIYNKPTHLYSVNKFFSEQMYPVAISKKPSFICYIQGWGENTFFPFLGNVFVVSCSYI